MKRIQRKRTRGWRMPSNTIYVGRPSKFGNPFSQETQKENAELFEKWLFGETRSAGHWREKALKELKGKDLACWCRVGTPCHADAFLKLLDFSAKED